MPRPRVALFIAPESDDGTGVATPYLHSVAEYAVLRGFTVQCLYGKSCTREVYESLVSRVDPKLIAYLDHGWSHACLAALDFHCRYYFSSRTLIDTHNLGTVRGRVVFALACWTAAYLGPRAVEEGCLTWFGWDAKFTVAALAAYPWTPWSDPVLWSIIMTPLTALAKLLDGASTGEAYQATIKAYRDEIDLWKRNPPIPEVAVTVIGVLRHDLEHFKLIGRRDVRVV